MVKPIPEIGPRGIGVGAGAGAGAGAGGRCAVEIATPATAATATTATSTVEDLTWVRYLVALLMLTPSILPVFADVQWSERSRGENR